MTTARNSPSPDIVFGTLFAYQGTAALRTAIELELFTGIDEGAGTVPALAKRCRASERGVRILCDFLSSAGFLAKSEGNYTLTPDSAAFLSQRSPAYLGTTARFLLQPKVMRTFDNLTDAVRRGGVPPSGENIVAEENPVWVEFARSMFPMMAPAAEGIADLVASSTSGPLKVLDIAAGHGLFGIAIAKRNSRAEVVALDWKAVLAVAEENARAAGVSDRYQTLAGDAFRIGLGDGYDLAIRSEPGSCVPTVPGTFRLDDAGRNPGRRRLHVRRAAQAARRRRLPERHRARASNSANGPAGREVSTPCTRLGDTIVSL
jgi:hypothetical protein